jgi:hypothetical protein
MRALVNRSSLLSLALTVSLALIAAIASPARAANLAEWNVNAANAAAANTVQLASTAAHVTAQPLVAHGSLDPPYASASTFLYRNWPTGQAPDPSKYYEFQIAPAAGYSIQLSSLSLAVASGSSGPATPTSGLFQITASTNGFATPGMVIATETFAKNAMWDAFDIDLHAVGTQNGPVTFRFSMYRVGGNAFSGVGSSVLFGNEGRNLVVNGSVFLQGQEPTCQEDETTLCIDGSPGDQRFQARVDFQTEQGGKPHGAAKVIPLNSVGIPSGGIFWFTNPQNPEMLLKVLNACSANGFFWVFYAAGTNFALRTEVVDTVSGLSWVRENPDRTQAPPVADIRAFPCSASSAPSPVLDRDAAMRVADELAAFAAARLPAETPADPVPRVACSPNANTLCIDNQPGDRRFEVSVFFNTAQGSKPMGFGTAIPLGSLNVPSGGIFWFTNPENPEMMIKVLNGCPTNGHFWVFYAAGTNFALDVDVVDSLTGRTWTSINPDLRQAPPVADILALPCSVP